MKVFLERQSLNRVKLNNNKNGFRKSLRVFPVCAKGDLQTSRFRPLNLIFIYLF